MDSKPKKILIVEDDKLLQQVYFDRLVKEGFVVIQAFTGQQGLTQATNYNPDLIILDIMLPGGLNGFDVLSQIKSNKAFNKIKVIVLTELKDQKKTAESLGANDYIIKEEDQVDDVIAKIKSYLK